jgi:methyl-accepting chemotaxis protein WspA
MKLVTIRQRLNAIVLLLTLMLLGGVGLALWMEKERSAATQMTDQLAGARDGLYYDVMLITDALRGITLDSKNELETRRHHDAEADLKSRLYYLQGAFGDFPDLLSAVKQFEDFVVGTGPGTLGGFQARVLDMTRSDTANALTYFNANYPELTRQRDLVFRDLARQILSVNSTLSVRSQTISVAGLAGLVAILIASLLIGRFQSASIAEPLHRLVATLERMRQGDFTQRLALGQKDEFGVVCQGLNHLAEDLCALVGQVQHSGIQVNTTATEIAATAKEQQATAHEIAATTAQIGATSKQISATSQELVKTMKEVNSVAEQTAILAGSGQSAISRMESTMRQIMEAAGSITSKLAVLNEKTTNINSVVTTITKVADQTNLLSLNAAIEAEKAGEYGLGFAVVAMEIRRLADQTAVATYDIEKMVKEMQSAVAAGVMGMDKFSEEFRRGVEEVRQVSSHLAQIIHQVQTLTPRFQAVHEGMHAQATGAQQISETLTQLSEAARQTADSLRQSNLAIEQLNGAARGLQTSVARFKLTVSEESLVEKSGNGFPIGL